MAILKQSTAYNRAFLVVSTTDHITGITGQAGSTFLTLSKNGAAFSGFLGGGGIGTGVVEIGNGWYYAPFNTTDTGTLGDLVVHAVGTSGLSVDPTDFSDQVQAHLISDISINGSGQVLVASNIKQNAALNGFAFVMTSSVTHLPQTGLSVTATRSLGGAAFGPCANAVTEIANGWYTINLNASDTNGVTLNLSFTATGADTLNLSYITQP